MLELRRSALKSRFWRSGAALVLLSVLAAACGIGEKPDDELSLPNVVDEAPLPVQSPQTPVPDTANWNCGAVKERVFTVVNRLDTWSSQVLADYGPEGQPFDPPELSLDVNGELAVDVGNNIISEALREAIKPLSALDLAVFDSACELYGQHDAALELWNAGNRGDACDVWRPAKQAADEQLLDLDVASLAPLVARFWSASTGDISEGHGRCIAEQAN